MCSNLTAAVNVWLRTFLFIGLTACSDVAVPNRPTALSSVDDPITRAAELERTTEGKAYRIATEGYLSPLAGVIIQCTSPEPHTRISSDVVFVISADGWIANVLSQSAVTAGCVARSTSSIRLPRPPKPNWLIHLTVTVQSS
jgi:hypothetical protein